VFAVLEPINPTREVSDGIRAHSWKIDPPPATEEGMVCRHADRIAYLTHDVDDAVRAGVIGYGDLPAVAHRVFGTPGSSWIATMIEAIVGESIRAETVTMAADALEAMGELRDFMFARVYLRPEATEQRAHAIAVIRFLVDHYVAHPAAVPDTYRQPDSDPVTAAIDYVSGMTDRFALRDWDRLQG
jgi:dGTPase